MKKYIAVVMTACLVLTGSIAYAGDTAVRNSTIRTVLGAKTGSFGNLKAEIKPLMEEVRNNRTTIQGLRSEAKTLHVQVKEAIKKVKSNKDTLTEDQIAMLQKSVEMLKASSATIKSDKGKIKEEVVRLKDAKEALDIEAAKASLQAIAEIQRNRIENITKINTDMNMLLNDLNAILE